MEYVQNKSFYHIASANNYFPAWEVGQTRFIGKTANPYWQYYDFANLSHTQNLETGYLVGIIKEYVKLTREWIYEEVRVQDFPQLPSRQRCIWVIPDDENRQKALQYWFDRLNPNVSQKIIQMSLTGKLHLTNDDLLYSKYCPLPTLREHAFKYWVGGQADKVEKQECLFEGFVSVTNIFDTTYDVP